MTEERGLQTCSHTADVISSRTISRDDKDVERVKRWIERAEDTMREYSIGVAPNINHHVLSNLRYEGEHVSMFPKADAEQAPAEQGIKDTNNDAQGMKAIDTIMTLMQPALDGSTTSCTKLQKSSLFRYCAIYCTAFRIDMHSFGSNLQGTESETRELIRNKCLMLAGLASFVVTYPFRAGQSHNSTVHAERAVYAVRSYYEHIYGRSPVMGRGVDFTRTLRSVKLGLRKLYPTTPMVLVPLLEEYMRAIRKVMDLNNVIDATY